jgi:hypothetical protein
MQAMLDQLSDYLPIVATLSPITVFGLGIGAFCTLLYLLTRAPEFLLIVITAMLYSAVPLMHRVF